MSWTRSSQSDISVRATLPPRAGVVSRMRARGSDRRQHWRLVCASCLAQEARRRFAVSTDLVHFGVTVTDKRGQRRLRPDRRRLRNRRRTAPADASASFAAGTETARRPPRRRDVRLRARAWSTTSSGADRGHPFPEPAARGGGHDARRFRRRRPRVAVLARTTFRGWSIGSGRARSKGRRRSTMLSPCI